MDKSIEALCELIDMAEQSTGLSALEEQISKCSRIISDNEKDSALDELFRKVYDLCRHIVTIKEQSSSGLDKLTLEERIELEQVEKIIDGNLLTYHFQPIVSAADGSIYSYEALMRPIGAPLISPYHILKYAALTNRLRDIERATLINVLTMIDTDTEKFHGKMVFINSIPNIVLSAEDDAVISSLLVKHSDQAVIEMTEQSNPDDNQIERLKSHYRTLNVRIAIDDYGTGYSNVKNLLEYTPNYVKIDRSLLSEIQNSQKKRHFVRDIIEFCHDNNILALAEGVETSEELRTVILLGIDLIQGYYTARPNPVIIDKIDDEIVAEILRYRDELRDGIGSKQYVARCGEKIILDKLARDGYSTVFIGKNIEEGSEVFLCGAPGAEPMISVICSSEFKGTVVLDSLTMRSFRNRPCISLADGSEVTIRITGESRLFGGGIQVSRYAKLNVVGHGALYIKLDHSDYYGIGNDLSSKHGEMIFAHNSMILIEANGQRGVGIGSGSGGDLKIHSGKYLISLQGSYGVGIGAFNKEESMEIHDVDLEVKVSAAKGCAIGALYSSSDIYFHRSSFRCSLSGLTCVGFGTPDGDYTKVFVENSNINIDIRADELTAVGSLQGSSEVKVAKASFNVNAAGHKALAFGGTKGRTQLITDNADVSVMLTSELDSYTLAAPEDIEKIGGRCAYTVNGELHEF
ncbi:MAG: EAL domain-containing protein [Ruminococcus sp.]|nr:EAL domain-containing protein [Ruminococcus sp.]